MNKKGSALNVGAFILLFVGIIVAIPLLQTSAQNIGEVTNTITYVNQSVAIPAALNTNVELNGKAVSSVVLTNASGYVISSGNYTITNNNVVNGQLVPYVTFTVAGFNGTTIRANYVSEPDTYASESSSRSIAGIIVLLGALAIAAFVIAKVYEDGVSAFDIR